VVAGTGDSRALPEPGSGERGPRDPFWNLSDTSLGLSQPRNVTLEHGERTIEITREAEPAIILGDELDFSSTLVIERTTFSVALDHSHVFTPTLYAGITNRPRIWPAPSSPRSIGP